MQKGKKISSSAYRKSWRKWSKLYWACQMHRDSVCTSIAPDSHHRCMHQSPQTAETWWSSPQGRCYWRSSAPARTWCAAKRGSNAEAKWVVPCPAGLFTAYLVIDEGSCQRHATLGGHYGRNTARTDAKEAPHHMPHTVEAHKVRHLLPIVIQIQFQQRCGYHAQQPHQIVGGQTAAKVKGSYSFDVSNFLIP